MPDIYATISEAPKETQNMLGDALELRAADPQMISMRRRYFDALEAQPGWRAIEIGCGTGDVVADLLQSTSLEEAIGLDPSPTLIERAEKRFCEVDGLSFVIGDGRDTGLEDQVFDLVVFHTTLSHVPNSDRALAEAFRLLKPGGRIVIFDGDYAANTVALGPHDPLQGCLEQVADNLINDKWLCRSLSNRLQRAGFSVDRRDYYPYLAEGNAAYFLSLISRGADFMAAGGVLDDRGVESLKAEARSRVENGTFFGSISFMSVVAQRPG